MDLRPDWWAAKTGFAPLPEIERIVTVPRTNDSGEAQAIILNETDTTFSMPPQLMGTIMDKNPKLITHSGREKPYGYVDWWTQVLWFNNETAPFDNLGVRHAINHAINRDQIVAFGQDGAGTITELPFPRFPVLEKYFDAARPLLDRYPVNDFQPAKTEEIMTRTGYTRDREGMWAGADGKRIDATIYGFDFMDDYGSVLAEQLRKGGFDASFQAPCDA
jgi:peptide/nickel transport system substrate-binding protein